MGTAQVPRLGIRVGIVGGSIAGCEVEVFERSRGDLVGRGAGIATPIATLRSLIAHGLTDANFPYVHRTEQPFIGRILADDRLGHTAWSRPVDHAAIHWGDLCRNLRRRVPDSRYHYTAPIQRPQ